LALEEEAAMIAAIDKGVPFAPPCALRAWRSALQLRERQVAART
jgi:hypothetical protein